MNQAGSCAEGFQLLGFKAGMTPKSFIDLATARHRSPSLL
jgi:hypothetical protein